MGVNRRHDLYDVQLGKATPVSLPGIVAQSIRTETTHVTTPTSGGVYAEHTAIAAQNPGATFTSVAIEQCWAEIALAGVDVSTYPTGLSLYAYKHAQGGTRASGANHRKYLVNEGLVLPRRITADHQGDAQIEYEVLPTYDGTNAPIVESDSVAVPTAGQADQRFAIGGVTIGGVTVEGIKSLELDLGQTPEREGADSDIWPTHSSIVNTIPMLTLRGIDVEWLKSSNIPLTGLLATHANTVIYLRKRSAGSANGPGYVADGTAEHIKITLDGMAFIDDAMAANPGAAAETSLTVATRYDGTNAPVTLTVNSLIT